MHLAERNLWRAIAKCLWALEIKPITDAATGKLLPPSTQAFSIDGSKTAFSTGNVRIALPYKISIKPRSAQHAAVIEAEYAAAQQILSKYE
jgi:hypothetical protein